VRALKSSEKPSIQAADRAEKSTVREFSRNPQSKRLNALNPIALKNRRYASFREAAPGERRSRRSNVHGANFLDAFRRSAELIDKVLRGAKPADIPVEQPTKFDLTINLTTAKALGLDLPPSLLARADEVIE
jgi:hypothetical protein